MFDKIKNKIENNIAEREERKKEKERMEKELIEQERQRLLQLNEKELLVELLLTLRRIEDGQKELADEVSGLNGTIWATKD